MKKNWLPVLLFCLSFCLTIYSAQSPQTAQSTGTAQVPGAAKGEVPAGFPATLLEGNEEFNLAIDLYADSRGNFGPCG
jgi:hypothetical protein